MKIGSRSVFDVCEILVGSWILLTRLYVEEISRIVCVRGTVRRSTLISPAIIILSERSPTWSMLQESLVQKLLSEFGGRYRQQRKYLKLFVEPQLQVIKE